MSDDSTGGVILLSGPVGAGKSTVARELIASSAGPTAYIEGDTFWSFIAKKADSQDESAPFRMIMRAMISSARHFLRDDYEVIVDFSSPPWFLDAARALMQQKPFEYVVLRPTEAVCAARAAARAEGTIADYSRYHDLYTAFNGAERYTIADDNAGPAMTAARIRRGLELGTFRVG
jgi:adenylylsulfate kinase-like enzyme